MATKKETTGAINEDATLYVGKTHVLFSANASSNEPAVKSKKPVLTTTTTTDFISWGNDNNLPKRIVDIVSLNSIILSQLHFRTNFIYSGGWEYGVQRDAERVGSGFIEIFEPLYDDKVERWLEDNNLNRFIHETIKDLLFHNHAAAKLSINQSRNYSNELTCQDFMQVRMCPQDKDTGEIKEYLVDANWPRGTKTTWQRFPLIDAYSQGVRKVREGKAFEYIYPLTIYSLGKTYYQDPAWQSIINTKWLEVAVKIPLFKDFLLTNQMGAKYVVHVPDTFWPWKYPEWDASDSKQKKAWRTETFKSMDDKITGVKNTGKTLFLTFKTGTDGSEMTKFEIVPLNGGKMMDGAHIEDSHEASSHIYAALNFNHTITGNSPGKGLVGGSGSDIMQASNLETLSNKIFNDLVFEPINFECRFNDWSRDGRRIKFRPKQNLLMTQNMGNAAVSTANGHNTPTKQPDRVTK